MLHYLEMDKITNDCNCKGQYKMDKSINILNCRNTFNHLIYVK
jgi:hypothetical protein